MAVPNNPFQNPFYNRFKDPVTRRHDELDTYAWLRTRHDSLQAANRISPTTTKSDASFSEAEPARRNA